jgi:hypothetical protein
MSVGQRRAAVARVRVTVGGLCLLAILATVVIIGETLRGPDLPVTASPEQDIPRIAPRPDVGCREPRPREGQERETTAGDGVPVTVSSHDLLDCPQAYDGRLVRYRGEVVGALLDRDIGVWTQLNDDGYADSPGALSAPRRYSGHNTGVGVLLPADLAAQVRLVGGPQTRGDVLEIEGTFNRVDPTGEVAVIRAHTVHQATPGHHLPDPPRRDRRIAAWLAVMVAGALVIAERVVARRR